MVRKHFKRLASRKYEKIRIDVFDFSIDYDAISVEDFLEIRKYLMKKNNMI